MGYAGPITKEACRCPHLGDVFSSCLFSSSSLSSSSCSKIDNNNNFDDYDYDYDNNNEEEDDYDNDDNNESKKNHKKIKKQKKLQKKIQKKLAKKQTKIAFCWMDRIIHNRKGYWTRQLNHRNQIGQPPSQSLPSLQSSFNNFSSSY